jgi:type VI protein secretion system component VasK
MTRSSEKLRRLAEVELLRAEMEARRMAKRTLWIAIAVLVGILALINLSYGGFLILEARYGAIDAAFIVGGTLTVIAVITLFIAMRAPGRTAQLEAEILARSIQDARDDLREDMEALEHRFDQISSGLTQFLKGAKPGDSSGPGAINANLAAVRMVLTALASASPALARYIQPILKILS